MSKAHRLYLFLNTTHREKLKSPRLNQLAFLHRPVEKSPTRTVVAGLTRDS